MSGAPHFYQTGPSWVWIQPGTCRQSTSLQSAVVSLRVLING